MKSFICLLFIILLTTPFLLNAETIGWRHDGTGIFDRARIVPSWSTTENVLWKTKLKKSNASPVVLKDVIFVCEEPSTLVCIKRSNGQILWRKALDFLDLFSKDEAAAYDQAKNKIAEIQRKIDPLNKEYRPVSRKLRSGRLSKELKAKAAVLKEQLDKLNKELAPYKKFLMPPTHKTNGYSSMTPVSDGKHVFVYYGTEGVVCYDLKGSRKWVRRVEGGVSTPRGWGHSSSPALGEGKLFVHVGKLHALNAKTGETEWEVSTKAAWGSVLFADVGGLGVIIASSGEIFRASDGKKLTESPLNYLSFNSPAFVGGVLYFIQTKSSAFRLKRQGEKLEITKLWNQTIANDRYYASPLIHKGLVYDVTRKGIFTVLDAEKGTVIYTHSFKYGRGEMYPSITLLGNRIMVSHEKGSIALIEPGRKLKIINEIKFEPFRASPVALGNVLYLKGLENFYCIGRTN